MSFSPPRSLSTSLRLLGLLGQLSGRRTASKEYPALGEAVYLLIGKTVELTDAVKLIQEAAPTAVVGAVAGFVAVRRNDEDGPTLLLHYEVAGKEVETFGLKSVSCRQV